ncbi:tetratricopeptide repeat protein [Myxococcus stipitatus]|uniref:tetratricopeptide repeat protein n=1 Tax=Myxococcus stipitatus TaxID=83455 RepID=UPI001F3AAB50|nr:tetratricopeptide repeat protein [Myxococcus stipitatus]MCE9667504.1 tetratricopeptide repeat protein [Myxococcus stipitatus]
MSARRTPGRWLGAWGLVTCLTLPQLSLAAGPLERDHPLIQQGREAYLAGRYEDALKAFEAAKKERPNDPTVDFNRGDALAKLGRVKDAQEVFRGVTESNRPDLRQKAWYNLGNLAATTGDRLEALKAYRRALTLDPEDIQARHNYEVVLRNLPPPQDKGQDGGTDGGGDGGQDGGRPDAGEDGGVKKDGGTPQDAGTDGGADGGEDGGADAGGDAGSDAGADGGADAGGGDGGADGGGDGGADAGDAGQQKPDQKGDGGADAGADGGQGEGEGDPQDAGADGGSAGESEEEDSESDAGVSPSELDKQEAERLLDAMKQNEKNLQLWRFQQKKKQRKPNEKDW